MPTSLADLHTLLQKHIGRPKVEAETPYSIRRIPSKARSGRVNIIVSAASEADCFLGIEAAGGAQITFTHPVRTHAGEYVSIGHE